MGQCILRLCLHYHYAHAALYVSIWYITSAGQIGGEAMTSPGRSQRSFYIQQLCDFFHVVTDILVVALYYPHFLFGSNKLTHNGEYTLAKLGLVHIEKALTSNRKCFFSFVLLKQTV